MKLVSVLSARAIWLFDLNRLNPGGMSYKILINGVRDRYSFSKSPASMLDVEDKALDFDQGEFITGDGRRIYVNLKVYSDGLVAITSASTNDSTEFLEELGQYIISLGFSFPPRNLIRRGFSSMLLVETTSDLLGLNPRLSAIQEFIESKFVSLDGKPRKYQMNGISMWSEDLNKPFAPTAFKFERRTGVPFDSNLYYSESPLQTDEHLELLNQLEELVG